MSLFRQKMALQSEPIYGINTGFGSLCNVKISNENLSKLQENLNHILVVPVEKYQLIL
jgi:histidine ammonia-lyase